MTGAHRRTRPFAVNVMPAMTARVVTALSGAANGGVPLGTFFNWSNMTGMTVTGVSMRTVPVTVGVRMRRNSERRAEKTNWTRASVTTSVASNAGPPAERAANADRDGGPGRSDRENVAGAEPAIRRAWSIAVTPQSTTEANTAHSRTSSGWLAARNTTVGIITAPGRTRQAICRARPMLSGTGIFASG